jgi:hypothetical protein
MILIASQQSGGFAKEKRFMWFSRIVVLLSMLTGIWFEPRAELNLR